MTRLGPFALTIATMFLIVIAVAVNSPSLFYMATAVAATLGASRLQAWLALRGLRFERTSPPAARLGERVTIETTVWSDRRIRRPLVTVTDVLPPRLKVLDKTPSLPVAPAFDQPIRTSYTFRPMRRGRFAWNEIVVRSGDALGLIRMDKVYDIEPTVITVYPAPIPVGVEIQPTSGWGTSELEAGRIKGSGLDPAGIREYATGDPLRYVHWRSSARSGRLMVKEFDTGSGISLTFWFQRTRGSDQGTAAFSSFEAMVGHALFLATAYIRRGAAVTLPQLEDATPWHTHPEVREREVRDLLTDVQPDSYAAISEDLAKAHAMPGTTHILLLARQDPALPSVIASLTECQVVCLVYDPADYGDDKATDAANDPTYLARLEAAGAETKVMPKVEAPG